MDTLPGSMPIYKLQEVVVDGKQDANLPCLPAGATSSPESRLCPITQLSNLAQSKTSLKHLLLDAMAPVQTDPTSVSDPPTLVNYGSAEEHSDSVVL